MNRTDPFSKAFAKLAARLALPSLVTVCLWLTSSTKVTLIEGTLALALLYIPCHAYSRWRRDGGEGLPIFAMVAFMYWLYYAMPVFWGDRSVSDIYEPMGRELNDTSIIKAEIMAIIGVCCLGLGFKMRVPKFLPGERIQLPNNPSRWNYLRLLLVCGCLVSFVDPSFALLGEGGRQVLSLAVMSIPALVFAILFRGFVRGESHLIDKILIAGFLVARLLAGLASGMLGSFGSIILICAAVFMLEHKRIPKFALFSVILFVLFFQPGKNDFRDLYWKENTSASMSDRIVFWVDRSAAKWTEALTDPSGEARREILNQSLSRVSLLTASGNVIDQTPSVVPYQYGRLYSYLGVALIPRFVWPNKPSVNEANQFYQLAYGISDDEQLKTVSISIGILVESYINFGWVGVGFVMFLLGLVLRFYQTNFFTSNSGLLLSAVGVVMLPQFLSIEGQLAGYVGGVVQQVLFIVLVVLPAVRITKANRSGHILPAVTGRSIAVPLVQQNSYTKKYSTPGPVA